MEQHGVTTSKKKSAACTICTKTFVYYPSEKSGKYCSRKCWGTHAVNNFGDKRGGKWTQLQRENFIKANTGKKHYRWGGENITYKALHTWVRRSKPYPKNCTKCNKETNLQWANVDHKYRRNLDDFIALCPPCHRDFDKTKTGECLFCKKEFSTCMPTIRLYCDRKCKYQHHKLTACALAGAV